MKKELLKIDELVFDLHLYPRIKVGWLTAYQYAQAMKTGSVFPPITVGLFKRKRYVVDGWHRIEALKILKEKYVEATVKRFKTKREMFAEAVKLNSVHGRPLSVHEKVRIIQKLEKLKFSIQQISEMVKVPVDKIEGFKLRIVKGPNGKPVYLKSVVAKALESSKSGLSGVGVAQDSFNVRSVQQLLVQLIELLESGVFPFEDENVKGLSIQLYALMGDKIAIKATS